MKLKPAFALLVAMLLVASTAFAGNMTFTNNLHATSTQMHPTQTAPDRDRDGGCARDNTGNLIDPTCKPHHKAINVAPSYTDKYGCRRNAKDGVPVDPGVDACKGNHVVQTPKTYTDKYGCERNAKDGTAIDPSADSCKGNHVVQTPATYKDSYGCVRDSQSANPVNNADENCHGHKDIGPAPQMRGILQRGHGSPDVQKPDGK